MEARVVSLVLRHHPPKRKKHHANSHVDKGGRRSLEAAQSVAAVGGTFDILSMTHGSTTIQKHHQKHHVGDLQCPHMFRDHGDPGRIIHCKIQRDDARCTEDCDASLL
jgi:hypothetical protein